MKAGPEAHFLAGQLFTMGVAAMAILPRMPSDHIFDNDDHDDGRQCRSNMRTIGGKLSYPFRRALLALISVGMIRVLCFHVILPLDDDQSNNKVVVVLDATLATIHVIGQSFLCLTTAYLLQCQLVNYINIDPNNNNKPGRNLVPYLCVIGCLTILGSIGSNVLNPNLWCLVNLAEAVSWYPVWKTLSLYTSVTSSRTTATTSGGQPSLRGPVLAQILTVAECWFFTTSLLSFIAEAIDNLHDDIDQAEGQFLRLLLVGIRQNQDNGVDDWTRLLLHSVFLNSLDELNHVTSTSTTNDGGTSFVSEEHETEYGSNDGSGGIDFNADGPLVQRSVKRQTRHQ